MSELRSSASMLKWIARAKAFASTRMALAKLAKLEDICVAIWSMSPAAPALSWVDTVVAICSLTAFIT